MSAETKDDGGLAFPASYSSEKGLSKRDYFAAKAMQGMYAGNVCNIDGDLGGYAAAAYAIADALVAEGRK